MDIVKLDRSTEVGVVIITKNIQEIITETTTNCLILTVERVAINMSVSAAKNYNEIVVYSDSQSIYRNKRT